MSDIDREGLISSHLKRSSRKDAVRFIQKDSPVEYVTEQEHYLGENTSELFKKRARL